MCEWPTFQQALVAVVGAASVVGSHEASMHVQGGLYRATQFVQLKHYFPGRLAGV